MTQYERQEAAREYLRDKEQEAENRLFEKRQRAHRQFIRSRGNFIESNPNAVSKSERENNFYLTRGLSERERQMAAQQRDMQDKINEGLIGAASAQGAEAADSASKARIREAELAGEYGYKKAELESRTGLTKAEQELAERKRQFDIQNGRIDRDGTYHPGTLGQEAQLTRQTELDKIRAENSGKLEQLRLQGENAVDLQSEANKGLATQELARQQRAEQEMANKVKLQLLKNKGALDAKKIDALTKQAVAILSSENPQQSLLEYFDEHKDEPDANNALSQAVEAIKGEGANKPKFEDGQIVESNGKKWKIVKCLTEAWGKTPID